MANTDPLEERTLYTITNEEGGRTTLTLDKLTADVLQESLPDVHAWVQATYDRVAARKPTLSRREKGDLVRAIATREAQKNPSYMRRIDELL